MKGLMFPDLLLVASGMVAICCNSRISMYVWYLYRSVPSVLCFLSLAAVGSLVAPFGCSMGTEGTDSVQ